MVPTWLLLVSRDRPTHRTQNKWEMSQSFSYARGAHAYKFGASWAKIGFNTNGPAAGAFGSFNYESAEDFLTDSIVDTFQVEVEGARHSPHGPAECLRFLLPGRLAGPAKLHPEPGDAVRALSEPNGKMGPRFDLFGFRYPDPVQQPGRQMARTPISTPPAKRTSPRGLGFAWDVKGDGKTVVRGGAGIYHVLILSPYLNTIVRKNPPDAGTLIADAATNLAGAVEFARAATPNIRSLTLSPSTFSEFIQHQMHPSYDIKFNLSVEREIARDLSVTLGYVGGQASNLT